MSKAKESPVQLVSVCAGTWLPVRNIDETGDLKFLTNDATTNPAGAAVDVINDVVPVSKLWRVHSVAVACRTQISFTLTLSGLQPVIGRLGPGQNTINIPFVPAVTLAALTTIKLTCTQDGGPAVPVNARLDYVEQDA